MRQIVTCLSISHLKTILESPGLDRILSGSSPESVGRALGTWLLGPNQAMRRLKCLITYDSFIEILERHPETIEGYRDTLEVVKTAMKYEFERSVIEGDESCGLIHGDFWSGNENAQFGHRAVDVSRILADLYKHSHFKGAATSIRVMKGFMDGYGSLSDKFAYRIAIHAGVHLICWYYRRDRNQPLLHPLPTVLAVLELGRDLILKAWRRDKSWLQITLLGPLFARKSLV
ncbi:hypothetical protein GGR51DRAFT_552295 [Nemania sp. FL0031]|nr:hypothetical protein GGR51DRAFT_552295 [Nemania sp. FL0031]